MSAAMMGFERSDDYQPLFWVNGRPVHVTTLLVALHILSLIVCCLVSGFTGFNPVVFLAFSSYAVLHHGAVWQVFTYAFAHSPSIWFLVDMAMLFWFGREVERYFGRKTFAALYAGLVLTAPVRGEGDQGWLGPSGLLMDGGQLVDFGVFIAFVTVYPNVQFFFGILAVWIAAAYLAIYTLLYFSAQAFTPLMILWADTAVAFFGTRYASMGSDAFAFFGNLRERFPRRPAPRGVKPRLRPRRAIDSADAEQRPETAAVRGGSDVHDSIDPLLDKISKHGLASLTTSERATLERARVSLLRKERGG